MENPEETTGHASQPQEPDEQSNEQKKDDDNKSHISISSDDESTVELEMYPMKRSKMDESSSLDEIKMTIINDAKKEEEQEEVAVNKENEEVVDYGEDEKNQKNEEEKEEEDNEDEENEKKEEEMDLNLLTSTKLIQKVLDFIEKKGDLSRAVPAQARLKTEQLWIELTKLLNDCGSLQKNTDQWKRIFYDLKANIKKKASLMRSTESRGRSKPDLDPLEERLLKLFTSRSKTMPKENQDGSLKEGLPLKPSQSVPPHLTTITGDQDVQDADISEKNPFKLSQPILPNTSTITGYQVILETDNEEELPLEPSPAKPPHLTTISGHQEGQNADVKIQKSIELSPLPPPHLPPINPSPQLSQASSQSVVQEVLSTSNTGTVIVATTSRGHSEDLQSSTAGRPTPRNRRDSTKVGQRKRLFKNPAQNSNETQSQIVRFDYYWVLKMHEREMRRCKVELNKIKIEYKKLKIEKDRNVVLAKLTKAIVKLAKLLSSSNTPSSSTPLYCDRGIQYESLNDKNL